MLEMNVPKNGLDLDFVPDQMVDLVRERAKRDPQKLLFTFLGDGEKVDGNLCFQDLDSKARRIAAFLQEMGLEGERALLLFNPGLEYISAFWGCLYAGVIAVPAYPPRNNRNLPRLQKIVDDADAKIALTSQLLIDKIKTMFAKVPSLLFLQITAIDKIEDTYEDNWEMPKISKASLAFLQYTSGSTGDPKGVMLSHGNLLHNLSLIRKGFGITRDSVGVIWLPPYHDMGLIGGILEPIYSKLHSIVIPPAAFLQRPIRLFELITKYKGTISGGPNFTYELCVNKIAPDQCEKIDLSTWKVAFNGAEPVRSETIEKFTKTFQPFGFNKNAFLPCYGLAECTVFVSSSIVSRPPIVKPIDNAAYVSNNSHDNNKDSSKLLVGCGSFFGDQNVKIVNPESFIECDEGVIGEIWVSGESVAMGYWNKEDETARIFNAHLANDIDNTYFRTEDLGFIKSGELFVTGRIKDLIIIRGVNYYPHDIEQLVEKCHPSLRLGGCAAFSIDVDDEEQLVLAQEIEFRKNPDIKDVVVSMSELIAEEFGLQLYSLMLIKPGRIPKTSSGKIQRRACKEGYLENGLESIDTWVSSELPSADDFKDNNAQSITIQKELNISKQDITHWLVSKLSQELKLLPKNIDISQPFSRYGLDSVRATGLAADLEDYLGCSLSATLVYDYPTIEELSTHLFNDVMGLEVLPDVPVEAKAEEKINKVLEKLEQLTDEEAEELLLKKLGEK